MKFELVCDSAADLEPSYIRDHQVHVVPFYVSMDSETYLRDGVDITSEQFYQVMLDNSSCFPKSSMPTIDDYAAAFRPLVQAGSPVLCICLTQTFSGSYQSARLAREVVLDEYPQAEIAVLDSHLVTALEGILVTEAVRLRDMELELSRALPLLEEILPTGHIFFTTKDLQYLHHGGRLGAATYAAGKMLDIKPLLHFCFGDLSVHGKVRGRKKSLQKVMDAFFDYLKEQSLDLRGYIFGTGLGIDVPEYADFVADLAQRMDDLGICPDQWIKIHIGSTIGVHTGPFPLGLGFLKKCEI